MDEAEVMRCVVAEYDDGVRLDIWLARVTGLSRSRVQALIRDGRVQTEALPSALAPKTTVSAGHVFVVTLPPPAPAEPQPQAMDLDVVYEDTDLIVLNKPAGLVVHPAAGHADGTLVNALLHHCTDLAGIGGTLRPGIVHRLDKDTSGLLVVAKCESALQHLAAQFQSRSVQKTYLAITAGVPLPGHGKIETQIGRSRHDRKKMSTNPAAVGKHAISRYHVLQQTDSFAWVKIRIETGRTHQIRLHLAHIGCPVAGDSVYGASRKSSWSNVAPGLRQMLHAAELVLTHPSTGTSLTFQAPVPNDMLGFARAVGLPALCY